MSCSWDAKCCSLIMAQAILWCSRVRKRLGSFVVNSCVCQGRVVMCILLLVNECQYFLLLIFVLQYQQCVLVSKTVWQCKVRNSLSYHLIWHEGCINTSRSCRINNIFTVVYSYYLMACIYEGQLSPVSSRQAIKNKFFMEWIISFIGCLFLCEYIVAVLQCVNEQVIA